MPTTVTPHPNKIAVVRPTGVIDIRSSEAFKQQLLATIDGGHPRLVLDLSAVTFIDSSGLGAMISGTKQAVSMGGDLRLANVTQQVRMMLELSRLQSMLRRYGSVADALASYQ